MIMKSAHHDPMVLSLAEKRHAPATPGVTKTQLSLEATTKRLTVLAMRVADS
jgi:hypothetical protein